MAQQDQHYLFLFQFQIGAIRGPWISRSALPVGRFNSKLVRLEERYRCRVGALVEMFQFQIGAIRGVALIEETIKAFEFQFQIGAIRGRALLV